MWSEASEGYDQTLGSVMWLVCYWFLPLVLQKVRLVGVYSRHVFDSQHEICGMVRQRTIAFANIKTDCPDAPPDPALLNPLHDCDFVQSKASPQRSSLPRGAKSLIGTSVFTVRDRPSTNPSARNAST